MTHEMNESTDEKALEAAFAELRAATPPPRAGFLEALHADAASAMPARPADTGRAPAGLLARISDALGGWPGELALAASVAAGIWIGYLQPAALDPVMVEVFGETADLDESFLDPLDSLLEEIDT